MSKNIALTIGDEGRTFTNVSKIYTPLSAGGTQAWIPEDECMDYAKFTAITIVEEGVFTPTSDGFLSVTVAIPETTKVRGTQNGVTVEYTIDSNGYLVFEEVD